MKSAQITIQNRLGLHARAAAKLVQTANQFSSAIRLGKDTEVADAKSIMEVLMLAGTKGTALTVTGEGSDEEIAVSEILRLINDKFGEGE